MFYKKVYVRVNADIRPDGFVRPLTLTWDDGCKHEVFEIDRVIDVRKGASRKAGGIGLRYLVRIRGKEKVLWYENPAWFIEVPENKYVGKMGD